MARLSNGYWLLDRAGAIYTFGDATFHGTLADHNITATAIALAPTPTGNGYTICDNTGAIYTFGDATFHGALADHQEVTGLVASDAGYCILDATGRVFTFGLVPFAGTPPFDKRNYFVDIAW